MPISQTSSVARLPGWTLRSALIALATGIALWVLGQLAWSWWKQPARFPKGPNGPPAIQAPSRLQQLRPRATVPPTLPSLTPGVPELVPGFEHVPWLKSPTLTGDLKTIVYVTYAGAERLDDLVIANRDSITQAFRDHQVLQGLCTQQREAHPALSADGLELLFVRQTTPSRIWIARRAHRGAAFEAPREVQFQGDVSPEEHYDAPQFLDAGGIHFVVSDVEFTRRRQLLARRISPNKFAVTGALAIANPWPRYFLTTKGRLAYFPAEEGIFLTAQQARTQEYVPPELLLPAATIGGELTKFDDTIWVNPQEDLIFYCSPGPGTGQAKRRLWMVRY
ncbi:hypothetical protein SAMN05421753_10755 [Planctomicrobium piriforme]|uniref:WD40-like Beta Propeller Repeat n=2 Tax=Planctomicrobium piriforme TaxID=1576369 RepID=A0A1I3GMB4_9PLAN|nr:hypothetical protein SAMN05421753_10755 [Planctomicrobium piriforme]